MSKFTKGPWEVKPYDIQLGGNWHKTYCVRESDDKITSGITGGIVSTIPTKPREEQRSNAHLIAAAPDMYAALKRLVDYVEIEFEEHLKTDMTHGLDCAVIHSRDILAKAEGKE